MRAFGSCPPGCLWKLSPTGIGLKRGASARSASGTPFSQRSCGSMTCESAEIIISWPLLSIAPLLSVKSLVQCRISVNPSALQRFGIDQLHFVALEEVQNVFHRVVVALDENLLGRVAAVREQD